MNIFYFSKMSLHSIAVFAFISLLLIVIFIFVSRQSNLLFPKVITGIAVMLNLTVLAASFLSFSTSEVEITKEKIFIHNFFLTRQIEKKDIDRIIPFPNKSSLKRSFGIDLFGGGIGNYFDSNSKYRVATANFDNSILIHTKTDESYILGLSDPLNFIKKVNL